MQDYQPIDLTSICNAGKDVRYPHAKHDPRIGLHDFRGLPFQISVADGKALMAFGKELYQQASIPVNSKAFNIVFAHAQLESYMDDGDPVGRQIATYTLVFADGSQYAVPVRQRFEIAPIPMAWGQFPFLAFSDNRDAMWPRYEGKWYDTGNRQQEAGMGWPIDYFLYPLKNPEPDKVIERIDVKWAGLEDGSAFPLPGFYIGAVTLGHVDEYPFPTDAAVPVILKLTNAEDIAEPFALEVYVDRGVAGYAYPLPAQDADAFLSSDMPGFGEEKSEKNSPAYVEVTATPSATVTVKKDGEEIGAAKWSEIEEKGEVQTPRVHFEMADTGRNWVHTTILDADTGRPIPCRVHFRSAKGIPYAPHGHHTHVFSDQPTWHIDVGGDVRLAQVNYAYVDGKCQGWLPRGEVIVDVARGYEYEPLREKITIEPGQRELTLKLKRKHHMNAQRYFSGDTHVHFLSSQGAITEASAEDLDVVNLLMSQWGHLFTNTEEFTGTPLVSGDKETIVYASQENRQHMLGHLTLLGLKEQVMPWCSDGPAEAEMGGNLEVTLSHWADECHAQGGTVVIPHLPNPNGEPAALIATGRADAVELLTHNTFFHTEYYRYLNGGYKLPIAGGTDKMDAGVPVGLYRTYVYIPPDEEFTYDNWLKGLRSGNTFLSGGPMIQLWVNGETMGSTVNLGRDGGTLEVEAYASSILPIHCLELVMNGSVVARTEEAQGVRELSLKTTIKTEHAAWLCARTGGPGYTTVQHYDSWRRGIMAHTSPVYISVNGAYDVHSADTYQYMLTLVDGSLQHIRKAPQWKPGTVTHHHHSHDHLEYLEGPLREAAEAIHRKMHQHGIQH